MPTEPIAAKAADILAQAKAVAPHAGIEITLHETVSELTRFANNGIHQNVAEAGTGVSVRTVFDQRTARASTNRLDATGVREVVERAVQLTRSQAEDAEILPLPVRAAHATVHRFDEATAAVTPALRARAVGEMVEVAKRAEMTTAGICATHRNRYALVNSQGLAACYEDTGAEFSVTMLAATSSGWAKGGSPRWRDIDPAAGARIAAEKARASADPVEVEPGRYTVILEPAAVLDLLGFLFWDFGGLAVLDQRSFLSDRVGTKLFGENITVTDDVCHPLQSGAPFDGEGVPRQRVELVERGTIRNLVYARQTALKAGKLPTGHGFPLPNEYGEGPVNVVVAGGETPVEKMIAETERGILVTRLWYIREVDPYQKILTGMTRDGTFLVEGGKIQRGVRNFRFNQNMIEMLNRVEALSPSIRASGEEAFDMVVPAMKVSGFNFTEVTKF